MCTMLSKADAENQQNWSSIELNELRELKITFNKVEEVLLKLIKKGRVDLTNLSTKIKGSILKAGCDGSSLPKELRFEAKKERAMIIKLRINKIKIFDFEKECTLCIPIDTTFQRRFKEFTKIIVQQAAA